MKYKIDDIIRIKSSSELKKVKEYKYKFPVFTSEMWYLCNKQYEILKILSESYYIIKDEFNREWLIGNWMLEKLVDDKGNFLLEL